nr:uncharacterized protein LOC133578432 [Nerophis lumbriciformis]
MSSGSADTASPVSTGFSHAASLVSSGSSYVAIPVSNGSFHDAAILAACSQLDLQPSRLLFQSCRQLQHHIQYCSLRNFQLPCRTGAGLAPVRRRLVGHECGRSLDAPRAISSNAQDSGPGPLRLLVHGRRSHPPPRRPRMWTSASPASAAFNLTPPPDPPPVASGILGQTTSLHPPETLDLCFLGFPGCLESVLFRGRDTVTVRPGYSLF